MQRPTTLFSDSRIIRIDNASFFGGEAMKRIELAAWRARESELASTPNICNAHLRAAHEYAREARHLASQAAHQAFLAHPELREQREKVEVAA